MKSSGVVIVFRVFSFPAPLQQFLFKPLFVSKHKKEFLFCTPISVNITPFKQVSHVKGPEQESWHDKSSSILTFTAPFSVIRTSSQSSYLTIDSSLYFISRKVFSVFEEFDQITEGSFNSITLVAKAFSNLPISAISCKSKYHFKLVSPVNVIGTIFRLISIRVLVSSQICRPLLDSEARRFNFLVVSEYRLVLDSP